MSKEKRKKYNFSKEEKKIIREIKQELKLIGIPRQDWAYYLRNALKDHARDQKKKNKRKESKFTKSIYRVKNIFSSKIQNLLFRKLKAKNFQFKDMNNMFNDQITDKDQRLLNSLFSGMNLSKKDIGEHGTFIMNRDDKKSYVVDFEDDDN